MTYDDKNTVNIMQYVLLVYIVNDKGFLFDLHRLIIE